MVRWSHGRLVGGARAAPVADALDETADRGGRDFEPVAGPRQQVGPVAQRLAGGGGELARERRRGAEDRAVGGALAAEALRELAQRVVVRMLDAGRGAVEDADRVMLAAGVAPRPLHVLGVADRLVERCLEEQCAAGRGAREREEEAPGGLHAPVAERTLRVLAHERRRVRARQLVREAERGAVRLLPERADELREPVVADRDGVGVVEHDDLAAGVADERVERAARTVLARGALEEADGEARGDFARAVRRVVVAHHDLEREIRLLREHPLERAPNQRLVVPCAHEDADQRLLFAVPFHVAEFYHTDAPNLNPAALRSVSTTRSRAGRLRREPVLVEWTAWKRGRNGSRCGRPRAGEAPKPRCAAACRTPDARVD